MTAKDRTHISVRRLYWVKQWMYRRGRPGGLAKVMNRISAIQFSAGILSPERAATLEVRGRRSGQTISFPVVVADYQGDRYLVSMLGEDANWVRNVRADGGRAALRRRHREAVHLEEVDAGARAPILRRYLALAPGARPHIPVDRRAPLQDFEQIAAQFPVFRISTAATASKATSAKRMRMPSA
jgi:deazaflavin-dependent oxidoreductase (nitroreductase family)